MDTPGFIFTFGKYKGRELDDVPAGYLLWFYDQENCPEEIRKYVKKHKKDLEIEAQDDKNNRYDCPISYEDSH